MSGFSTSGFLKVGATVMACENITYNPGITTEAINTGGLTAPLDVVGMRYAPVFTCTTKDVIRALSLNLIATDMASSATEVYTQHFKSSGVLETQLTKWALSKGLVVIDSISAPQGAVATAQISIYPASTDGQAEPFTETEEGAAAPTYTKQTSWLSVGTFTVNNVTVSKSTGLELTFNHVMQQEFTKGSRYPIDVYSRGYAPVMKLSHMDSKSAKAIVTEQGKRLTVNGVDATLFSTNSDGVLVNTVGKTLSINQGFAYQTERSYAHGSTSEFNIEVHATYDATNAALEVA